MAGAEPYAAEARAEAIGGTDNLIKQAVLAALVEMAKESKTPLVPSVQVGDASLAGLPGLLVSMLAKDGALAGKLPHA